MRDGARIHTANSVKEWFQEHGIILLDWPAYSPDLNPIENLWAILKELINKEYPTLFKEGASQAAIDHFARVINEMWHEIPQEVIDSLIKSMDQRVNHVLAAKGWQTRY